MAEQVVLTLHVTEGDIATRVQVTEFDCAYGCPTREGAIAGITSLVPSHCRALVARQEMGDLDCATPLQFELARQVLEHGFVFNIAEPTSSYRIVDRKRKAAG